MKPLAILASLLPLTLCTTLASTTISIPSTQPTATISPTMYGVFFEDINFAADGGIYAELVKNRSFEFDKPLRGWTPLKDDGIHARFIPVRNPDSPRNPRFLRVQIDQQGSGVGLNNEGFRGMGVHQDIPCNFTILARKHSGNISGIRVELVAPDKTILATGSIRNIPETWQELACNLTPSRTEAKATLNVWFEGEGTIDIDMVSLFPSNTWKGRHKGLRADLVQLLADMKPGFLRFPGGCIVEGFDLSQRYQWKNTVGDIADRVTTINRWNFEFTHRPAPDYYQSFGLGFYEYFLLSEDLGAEPMPIINCGMACQFNTAELVPLDALQPYIQDALDLIEFANGPTSSTWGKLRADMGHPEPFHLKMLGIGNEQWGPQYVERYVPMVKAIKARYPDIQIIAATGSDATIFPNGKEEIDYVWKEWRKLQPEFVDEHFYRNPQWFLENTHWYDDYDRNGPQLFVGEYASQSVGVASPQNRNSLRCALYEAAFITGMERNADLVRMTCYAPLFIHEDAWQWRPDLIAFDNLTAYGSVNYHVQKLFSLNRGTHLLNTQLTDAPVTKNIPDLHVSSTLDQHSHEIIIKAVNVGSQPLPTTIDLQNTTTGPSAKITTLTSANLDDENTLRSPNNVAPKESTLTLSSPRFTTPLPPHSFNILRIPLQP